MTGRRALPAVLFAALLATCGPAAAAATTGVAPGPAAGATLVVAPGGSDRAPGTVAAPLRTVARAASLLPDGGRIELRGGRYHQRLNLNGAVGLTVEPYRGEHPVLDGAGLTPPPGMSAMIAIRDCDDVTIRGLEITGYRTRSLGVVPIGIYLHGGDAGITITHNHVHDLGNLNGTRGSFDINAHGIAAYGDDPRHPITGLRIQDNTVDHLILGASESVVVNGNVDHWAITGNSIHDDNNIGIDAIGFEPTITGRLRYTDRNRARNGLIAGNRVSRIRSQGNPAYYADGGYCNCADGIYVDGGTHVVIRDNTVRASDIGVEVAAENPRGAADHVTVAHNTITGSRYVGITTGGYCDGGRDCGSVRTGRSFDNLFSGNTLRANNQLNDGSPEILIQYYASHDRFTHNDITATDSAHAVYGTVPRTLADGGTGDNTSDHNIFRVARGGAAPRFGWLGREYPTFGAYRRHTGQDRHSRLLR